MKSNQSTYFFSILYVLCSIACQAQDGPPPMPMPSRDNKPLIEEIIKVTEYETYFRNYCLKKVDKYAAEHNFTSKKKEEIIQSIQFKYFDDTIYNLFAFYTSDELKQLIKLYKELNKNKSQKLIVTNDMVEGNLELFAESIVLGKYVM